MRYYALNRLIYKQMVFLIDLPLKSASDQGQQTTMFLTNMQQYLLAMGVDDGMIASLSKYDFSRTKSLGFVYSMYVSNILAIYING